MHIRWSCCANFTMFQQSFKYYKAKCKTPDLSNVIDFDHYDDEDTGQPILQNSISFERNLNICKKNHIRMPAGLKPLNVWRSYALDNHPGLLVIRNPFTERGQRYWAARCLQDYPRGPNKVNLNERLFPDSARSDWWKELHQCDNLKEMQRLKVAMRWTTFGYHHNWDTKIYDVSMHSPVPDDLNSLCAFFASVLGFNNFKAEAGIVNYYPIGTSLSGHTDHSEPNHSAPLFSFSFGQTAIFLIGGKTNDETPTALYIHSGDVLIMSEESRLCYHAVPRIIKTQSSWTSELKIKDIEIEELEENCLDKALLQKVGDWNFWKPFSWYLNDSRININVRQVLKPGESTL
ncbi:blast:Alkylated DNA repair protein alkB homolog 1 [Drosophila guanche]|uniref:Blast:Alkylated DNA repair protein alkB homolog 1 n=1 Tax=Drosophila guanche TaxID=7266 RepID=A0A3B0K1C4_DROGU|nr:blast:Alkylated DNA repair protein alkB homolog 1 [Drosophila guanche]